MDGRPYDLRSDRLADHRQQTPSGGQGGPLRPYEQRELTTGNVIGEALEVYRQFFVHFFSIALAVFLATNIVSALATLPRSDTFHTVLAIVGAVAGLVGFFALQGALAIVAEDVRDGQVDLGLRELIARTRGRFAALVGTSLLVGLLIGVGAVVIAVGFALVHLILLGIILAGVGIFFLLVRWSLVTPVVVLDRVSGIAALERSSRLVRGHGRRVFVIVFVSSVMAGIVSLIVAAVLRAVLSGFLEVWLASSIGNALTTPFLALAWTLMYFHLRAPTSQSAPPGIPSGAAYVDE